MNKFPTEISVLNFVNNEIVHHEIILLKGLLNEGVKCCENVSSQCLQVYLNNHSSNFLLDQHKHLFKCLLVLDYGSNSIKLVYCCLETKLDIVFEESKTDKSIQHFILISKFEKNLLAQSGFIESAAKRISLGLKLIQCFLSEKMFENGLKRKIFNLKKKCLTFLSNLNFYELMDNFGGDQRKIWNVIGNELLDRFPDFHQQSKFMVFLFINYKLTPIFNENDFYKIAIGGGGLALFSFEYLFTWPDSFSQTFAKFGDRKLLNAQFSYGDIFSKSLGAVCHELCHAFDLGHCSQGGIMGTGYQNLHCFYTLEHFRERHDLDDDADDRMNFRSTVFNCKKNSLFDCNYLSKTDCTILYYHKWFNKSLEIDSLIFFDASNKCLKSNRGLRVVEIRDNVTENVIKSWLFLEIVLKFHFQIPFQDNFKKHLLFVQDSRGLIKKFFL